MLGVTHDASTKEINIAFKKLALKLHPDKSGGDRALLEQFHKVCDHVEELKTPDLSHILLLEKLWLIILTPRHGKLLRPFETLNAGADTMNYWSRIHSRLIRHITHNSRNSERNDLQTNMARVAITQRKTVHHSRNEKVDTICGNHSSMHIAPIHHRDRL